MDVFEREMTEIVGEYVAVLEFKISPAARLTEADIRTMLAKEADNIIAILKERAPQVLVTAVAAKA